jgi:copper oxidase (laccase) domain-containing protein
VNHADLLAYIGPGIGANAFEVGRDVFDAFTAEDAAAAAAFRRHTSTKWYADLVALTRRALARCGVTHVYGGDACTYSDPARFYSHRRNSVTGRMAALIWREHAGRLKGT